MPRTCVTRVALVLSIGASMCSLPLRAQPLTAHAPTLLREASASVVPLTRCQMPPSRTRAEWPAPLDRRISVRGGVLSLREALDRVAAAARVRLTYSDALLPLERRVCLDVDDDALGDAITMLLGSVAVSPQVAGGELVVLAPVTPRPQPSSSIAVAARVAPLERVVVTGSATGSAQRSLSVAVGVVDGATLTTHGQQSVASQLNGVLPGVWLWQQSPASVLSRYGSIRGASSFGVSYPKMYIDGVEVANPLVVAQVPAESIERLEVLRGPQGAALYGTDAISGVINMITRQPARVANAPSLRLRAQSGLIASAFSETGTFGQELTLTAQRGDVARSAVGSFAFSRVGAFVPDGSSQHVAASGRAQAIGTNAVLDATLRLALSDVSSSSNPLLLEAIGNALVLPDSVRPLSARRQRTLRDSAASRLQLDRSTQQSLRQITAGVSGTFHPSARWTHRATVGVDAYTLDGTPGSVTPLPSSTDSALRAAEGSAARASARTSSAATWRGDTWQRTVTFSAEHAVLREASSNEVLQRPRDPVIAADDDAVWRQTTGGVAQLDGSWQEQLFVTAGTRVERSAGFTSQPLITVLPMVGAAWVLDAEQVTFKLRGAYGKGIRPPRITVGGAPLARNRLVPNDALEPEAQSGTELGVDLFWGRRAALHLTRFDQTASGLVQPVSVVVGPPTTPQPRPGDPFGRNLGFQMQNVGAIDNSGWELEGVLRGGAFTVQGSLALVESRVRDVRRGYTGELRIGDRMLDVPARTAGLSARWQHNAWSAAVQLSHVADWIGYDRLAAAEAFVTPGKPASTFVGASLRNFWLPYDGVTRVGTVITRQLPRGVSLRLAGDNLLDTQVGEPDNITILPGRTISLGLQIGVPR